MSQTLVHFLAAEEEFLLRGPSHLKPSLSTVFGGFAKGAGRHCVVLDWSDDQCNVHIDDAPADRVRIKNPRLVPQITTFLVGKILQRLRPDMIILHGNALVHEDGRVLLLVGASGSGKSTLTREIMRTNSGYHQVSEDYLLIEETEAPILHPFPRAAAMRKTDQADDDATVWNRIGAKEGKILSPVHAEAAPLYLRNVDVVLLDRPAPSRPLEASEWQTWVTALGGEAAAELKAGGISVFELTHAEDMDCITHSTPPTDAETRLLFRTLERNGGMILHHGPRFSRSNVDEFPASAECHISDISAAIAALLPHVRRYSAADMSPAGGIIFLKLARFLQAARFSLLLPGGTPAHTVELLLQHIDSNHSRQIPHTDAKVQAPLTYLCGTRDKEGT